jgi:histidine triad (HIT) family protein
MERSARVPPQPSQSWCSRILIDIIGQPVSPTSPEGKRGGFLVYNGSMNDCLFCSIANGDKDKLIWENEHAAAFNDIHPAAPVHVLVVPKRHATNLDELDDPELAGQLLMAVRSVAQQLGIAGRYRVQINNGRMAGQVVDHLHLHVKAGEQGPQPA